MILVNLLSIMCILIQIRIDLCLDQPKPRTTSFGGSFDITTGQSIKTSHRLRITVSNPSTNEVFAITAECPLKPLHN